MNAQQTGDGIHRLLMRITHQYTNTNNTAKAAALPSPMPKSTGASFAVNVAANGALLTLTVLFDILSAVDPNSCDSIRVKVYPCLESLNTFVRSQYPKGRAEGRV
jgi:hypothetical protein